MTEEQLSGPAFGTVTLPDGTSLRCRGRRGPPPAGPDPTYAYYLGGRWRRSRWQPPWPHEWVDWPDFRTPRCDSSAAAAIVSAYRRARAGERVEIACYGGTGRTCTAVACLAVLAGVPAREAVAWARANYRPRAAETRSQRCWVGWFAGHHPPLP